MAVSRDGKRRKNPWPRLVAVIGLVQDSACPFPLLSSGDTTINLRTIIGKCYVWVLFEALDVTRMVDPFLECDGRNRGGKFDTDLTTVRVKERLSLSVPRPSHGSLSLA